MNTNISTPLIAILGVVFGLLVVGIVLMVVKNRAKIGKGFNNILKGIAFLIIAAVFALIPHYEIGSFPLPVVPIFVSIFGWGNKFWRYAGILGAIFRVALFYGLPYLNSALGVNL